MTTALTVRRASPTDVSTAIDICSRSLGWSDHELDADFFRWKHVDNPFGRSPIWLAEASDDDGEPGAVGVRAMMRWELVAPGGQTLEMTRAVDTATLPSHQGQGIFTSLTTSAVEELTVDGVSAVFNTPNDKSRPGYLKMGWEVLGRVPIAVRPSSPAAMIAAVRSKTAAEKWGEPTAVGLHPDEALADGGAVGTAVAASPRQEGWATPLTVEYLRWRTGFAALNTRIEPIGSSIEDGFVVFRLRRRGRIRQLSVLHVVSAGNTRGVRRTIGRLLSQTEADLAMAAGTRLLWPMFMGPLPSAGPVLTWRCLADEATPPLGDLALDLGTIELF